MLQVLLWLSADVGICLTHRHPAAIQSIPHLCILLSDFFRKSFGQHGSTPTTALQGAFFWGSNSYYFICLFHEGGLLFTFALNTPTNFNEVFPNTHHNYGITEAMAGLSVPEACRGLHTRCTLTFNSEPYTESFSVLLDGSL